MDAPSSLTREGRGVMARLKIVPATLAQANEMVARWHRHHKPARGHRFSIGVQSGDRLCGAAIIGRPTGRRNPQYDWVEVTRLVTDGTKNACSKLYGAAARVAKEMGFSRIQTFVLDEESAISLRAAGWVFDGHCRGGNWNQPSRGGRRVDQPQQPKQRWRKDLSQAPASPEKEG